MESCLKKKQIQMGKKALDRLDLKAPTMPLRSHFYGPSIRRDK
jgi:hypothetical protein